ncbi:hypothetical protein AA14337_2996 [Acetobacter malorum DSM 14337]|uniref:Uncharacterized protein n=1 Tax=Acetobacter malorum DSM 14337 TaxID=1307910 RepID=A0ABQ0PZ10_9PROT|nr:hypothetical protein [Acetobacter malorum]KXV06709.1 hypothetical protein AD930_06285 [Acetobacter malorum]GBQ85112.1 hypothetical protein AA14337_2996 [Acetobacter malorum DSM 14337]
MTDSDYLDLIDRLSLNITANERGVGAIAPDGKDFWGDSIRECLQCVAAHYSPDIGKGKFHGFRIGELVEIAKPKTPLIISYGGRREGFPSDIIGRLGGVRSFDRQTMSLKTVCVRVDGVDYWGSHLEIKPPQISGNAS